MTESVENKPKKKLTLHNSTLENFMSCTARTVMNVENRLEQKKEKLFRAVPVLNKIRNRVKAFDRRMEQKYGQVYVKIRDSAKNITRTVLAAKLFGLPGVVGICAYKTCEKAMSLLRPAEKAKQKGKADSVLDYLSKNKDEAGFTMTSGSISIATATCDVLGAYHVKAALRVGKATLLISPEVKNLVKTTGEWLHGRESFNEVRRDAAVMGITFGTYFVSDVPMTRGSGKPKHMPEPKMHKADMSVESNEKAPIDKIKDCFEQAKKLFGFGKSDKKETATQEKSTYKDDVNKLFAAGVGNPGGMITLMDIKSKKSGR